MMMLVRLNFENDSNVNEKLTFFLNKSKVEFIIASEEVTSLVIEKIS